MTQKQLKRSIFLSFFLALLSLAVLTSSTYAWFTFRAYTSVTPLAGTVGSGDGSLLISSDATSGFDVTCSLVLSNPTAELFPVSTVDIEHFYVARTQKNGQVLTYTAADETAKKHSLSGTVYLKADGADFNVYLWPSDMDCGKDPQSLAAMRLGLKVQTKAESKTYVFRLDDLGSTTGAEKNLTVPTANTVVKSISAEGVADYVADPSLSINDYAAQGTEEEISAGKTILCALDDEEVGRVDFCLYLEGCDENCYNPVQGKDIALQLAFAGVTRE